MLMPMAATGSSHAEMTATGPVPAAKYQLVQRLMDSLLHDARNPLNALAINLDVLTEKLRGPDRQVPPNQEKNLKAMREQIFRVDGILRGFADYLAPKSPGQGGSEPPAFTDRVVKALEVAGHELRRNRIALRQMLEPNVRTREQDATALNFLPLQAVMRAVSRCQAGGEVSVTLTADGGRAVLRVTDAGPESLEPSAEAPLALKEEAERMGGECRIKGGECVVFLPLA